MEDMLGSKLLNFEPSSISHFHTTSACDGARVLKFDGTGWFECRSWAGGAGADSGAAAAPKAAGGKLCCVGTAAVGAACRETAGGGSQEDCPVAVFVQYG
jgi:hypothetical protein